MASMENTNDNLMAKAIKDAIYGGLIAFGLFVLLIGLRTDQNIKNELILVQRWGLLALVVAIVMAVRFVMTAFISPALAARKAAKAATKVAGLAKRPGSKPTWES